MQVNANLKRQGSYYNHEEPPLKKPRPFDREAKIDLTVLSSIHKGEGEAKDLIISNRSVKALTSNSAIDFYQLLSRNDVEEDSGAGAKLEEALDQLNSGEGGQLIIAMIQDGSIALLGEEERDEVVDSILISENREAILHCINLGLKETQKRVIIDFALSTSDLHLIKAVINDSASGVPYNFFENCSSETRFLYAEHVENTTTDPEIGQFFYELALFSRDDAEEVKWRKYLGNLWGRNEEEFEVGNHLIQYAAIPRSFLIDRLIPSFHKFNEFQGGVLENKLLGELYSTMEESRVAISAEQRLKRYQKGKPILIHAGLDGHQMNVVLWGKLMMICNKGLFSEVPVKVYQIDPNLVSLPILDQLRKSVEIFTGDEDETFYSAKKFYKSTLPKLLNNGSVKVRKSITNAFTNQWLGEKKQTNSDCVWQSCTTALSAIAGIYYYKKEKKRGAIAQGLEAIDKWKHYVLLIDSIAGYLEHSARNPARMDVALLDDFFSTTAITREQIHPKAQKIATSTYELYKEMRPAV